MYNFGKLVIKYWVGTYGIEIIFEVFLNLIVCGPCSCGVLSFKVGLGLGLSLGLGLGLGLSVGLGLSY